MTNRAIIYKGELDMKSLFHSFNNLYLAFLLLTFSGAAHSQINCQIGAVSLNGTVNERVEQDGASGIFGPFLELEYTFYLRDGTPGTTVYIEESKIFMDLYWSGDANSSLEVSFQNHNNGVPEWKPFYAGGADQGDYSRGFISTNQAYEHKRILQFRIEHVPENSNRSYLMHIDRVYDAQVKYSVNGQLYDWIDCGIDESLSDFLLRDKPPQ